MCIRRCVKVGLRRTRTGTKTQKHEELGKEGGRKSNEGDG